MAEQETTSNINTINDQAEEETRTIQPLISGLPNDIAELCLLRLPYPYHALYRSVSSSWNKTITNPRFLFSKQSLSISSPYLFVFAFNKSTARIQWQSLDLSSGRWFVLPPMPNSFTKISSPHALSCASIPRQGKLFVLGGGDVNRSAVVYTALTNRWSCISPMMSPRTYFVSGNVNGKIMAVGGSVGGNGEATTEVESYDPDNDTWTVVKKLPMVLAKYDSAVIGKEMCVTEGWAWPFMFPPMGEVYDSDEGTWREMSGGMKEGWTGVSVVIRDRLFVISEHGDFPMKVYCSDDDTWRYVSGEKLPGEKMRRPFAVTGADDRVFVVASGINVAEGRVSEGQNGDFSVEWRMVSSPKSSIQFSPASCHVLYV
ncbi:F-box-like domain superfamily [Arabidopsis suecica]|uniref:F-box-like domain superfamily n=1 Tax=Arabidopsis suecica TaxID=45249 RepID=A0A8T2GF21_ARASU|nr:F-box-like domain superfamily [Arabidopsis suecica]